MSAIAQLGSFIAGISGDTVAAVTRAKLSLHVVDTLGAWIAGSATAEGRALIASSERRRSEGADLRDDVARNCALARLSEVDDIHLASMTTPGGIVIPAALTLAGAADAHDGPDLVAAIVAGYEAMIRLGLAIDGPTILYRGIWPTYFAAPFAVAAVASRLMRLSEQETAHALASALTLAAPGVGHHNAPTTSRWFAVGHAAQNGLAAARAAHAGFTSDLGLMDSAFFPNVYGITPRSSGLTEGLGGEPLIAQVSFKPWCAARQTMAATQALREVIAEGVRPDAILGIKAAVVPAHLKMIDHGVAAGDRASRLTSLPYHMAVAALAPAAASEPGSSAEALPGALAAFMARIEVAGDDGLLAGYPSAWPARISVETRSGTVERRVDHVPGDPARPFAAEDVHGKFRRVVGPVLGPDKAEAMLGRLAKAPLEDAAIAAIVGEVNQICAAGPASGRVHPPNN